MVTPAEYEEIHEIAQRMLEFITAVDQAAYKQMQKYTSTAQNEKPDVRNQAFSVFIDIRKSK